MVRRENIRKSYANEIRNEDIFPHTPALHENSFTRCGQYLMVRLKKKDSPSINDGIERTNDK